MWAALESGLFSALEAADTPSIQNPKTSAEYVKRTYKTSAPRHGTVIPKKKPGHPGFLVFTS